MIGSTCVVCLKHTRLAESLFQHNEDLTYADMIAFVANIEIVESKSDKAMICLICQRKLKELYDFKVLIRRSYSELNAIKHRRLVFDNIDEFKFLLKPIKDKAKQNLKHLLLDNKNFFTHYETAITRIYNEKPITVTDVPESIIEKYEHDDVDDEDDNDEISDFYNLDDSYPEYQKDHNNKNIDNNKTSKKSRCLRVCIKPVYLRDITTKPIKSKRSPKYDRSRRATKIICAHCGILTKYICSHMLIHTGVKKFKCENEKCNKRFFTRGHLNAHIKIHFPNPDAAYKCDHCTAVFTQQTRLVSHMSTHTDNRPHICDICQRNFKRPSTLTRHKLIHTIPMCKCEVCGIGFRTKSALRHHQRVHTGERPFNYMFTALQLQT
ncbi:zinc finger protein 431-like isoform X2 [Zerene cesonia]|uniref:zinc finger protein 431-like isoform X2 n=1 Tax=Zerene cesonia TaxID=33412 RepID=UPI0018E56600|nr:zinc finger protein 431-like isoform X2 [Zerene cesonia]